MVMMAGCTVGCECDRYIEIWNNVFTQFENDGKGSVQLFVKMFDTGMGLERLATVISGCEFNFWYSQSENFKR